MELLLRGERVPGFDEGPKPGRHPFDEQYGVETSGLVWGERLRSGRTAEYWATGYYGISPAVFWRAMDRLGLPWERFSFIDIGSGMGRAVMLATRYPLRAIVGVELSEELTRAAKANLQRFRPEWRGPTPVTVTTDDAMRFEIPGGPLVLYLYHPFAAPVMEVLLRRVREAIAREEREVYLVYVNPELDGQMGRMPFLERLWYESFPLAEEEIRADRFGSREERVSAYRFRLAEGVGGPG